MKLMPGVEHETAHTYLVTDIQIKLTAMGFSKRKFSTLSASTFKGNSAKKQGDSALKRMPEQCRKTDWPTLVIGCGVSESLTQLHQDAPWWLTDSGGDVRTVIIITSKVTDGSFVVEKWQLRQPAPAQPTRSQTSSTFRTPTCTKYLTVSKQGVANAYAASGELVIEFEELLLRRPVPPAEHDLIFSRKDLTEWAED